MDIKTRISFVYGGIDLSFVVLSDGRIRLEHYGRIGHLIDCSSIESSKFVEIGVVGLDHEGHHGVKHLGSSFGEKATYVSHAFFERPNGKELLIVTTDGLLRATTHFLVYKKGASFSIYNEIENISDSPLIVEYVSSLFLYGFDEGKDPKELSLAYATNGWHMEAQWSSFSFFDLGIYDDKGQASPKRWHISNVGSWSTKEFLPMLSLAVPSGSMLIEIESNGGWDIEIAGVNKSRYLFTSGPNMTDSSWMKSLQKNESFTAHSSTLSFGNDFEEALENLTLARRLMVFEQEDYRSLPVVFNSYMHALWDLQTEESLKPLIDVASKVGSEIFCIDAGWFSKDNKWWDAIGDWEEEKANFPHGGLKATIDYIHSLGLKAGLWIEIENVGERSNIWREAPKSWFLSIHGIPVMEHERHCLDFANPEVYSFAKKTFERLINTYGLDYIKTDYNVDAGVGSDRDAFSLGDGLLKHQRAILKFYEEIEREFPHLSIENCASGGARMDYETLKRFPIQSTSDQTDYRLYPYIASNVLTGVLPEQAAVWSYPVDSSRKVGEISDEDVAMNMVNSLLGRIHLASFLNKLPFPKLDLVREGVEAYKKIKPLKTKCYPFYPSGLAHFGDSFVSAGIKDEKTMVLNVWNTGGKEKEISINLKKYGKIKKIAVLYPTSLPTDFKFDPKEGKLTLEVNNKYMGRSFIATLE